MNTEISATDSALVRADRVEELRGTLGAAIKSRGCSRRVVLGEASSRDSELIALHVKLTDLMAETSAEVLRCCAAEIRADEAEIAAAA